MFTPLFKKYVSHIKSYLDSKMTLSILKSSISLFSQYNDIRNNFTYAHDNNVLGDIESKLIFNNIVNVKNFIDELQMSNSRNYKLDILRKYKDDENVKYYLNFLYNPYITTGISDKKLYKEVNKTVANIPENFSVMDLLNYIKDNNTGSDYIIGFIQKYKNDIVDVDLYETLDALITKNFPLGIDVKSINKCIPGLIPEFNVIITFIFFYPFFC